ncbi:MAG: hypothetical protein RL757_2836 [Bacteroidota bacterium]|jgi:hypothetical protein
MKKMIFLIGLCFVFSNCSTNTDFSTDFEGEGVFMMSRDMPCSAEMVLFIPTPNQQFSISDVSSLDSLRFGYGIITSSIPDSLLLDIYKKGIKSKLRFVNDIEDTSNLPSTWLASGYLKYHNAQKSNSDNKCQFTDSIILPNSRYVVYKYFTIGDISIDSFMIR